MALNNLGLGFVFTAEDLATGVMSKVRTAYGELQSSTEEGAKMLTSSMKQMAVGFGIAVAGASAAIVALKTSDVAGAFEYQLAAVSKFANATQAQVRQLHDAALQAGIDTQYAPLEAAKALQGLSQNFHTVDAATKLLIPTLDLAAASLQKLSPEESAKTISQAVSGYGKSVNDATFVTDQLVRATEIMPIKAEELSVALSHTTGAAVAMGGSMSESLLTVGLLSKVMGDVNEAATGAKEAMLKFAEPKVAKEVQALGVQLKDVHTGGFRPVLDILLDLSKTMDKSMSQFQQGQFMTQLFGMRGGPAVMNLMAQLRQGIPDLTGKVRYGADAISYFRAQMDGAAGSAKEMRDALLNTLLGQQILLHGSMEALALEIGEPFAAVTRPFVEGAIKVINAFIGILNQMPMGLKKFLAGSFLAAAGLVTLTGVVLAGWAAWGMLDLAIDAAVAALAPIVAAIAPFLPLILGVAAAIGLLIGTVAVMWEQNIGGMATKLTHVWNQIKLFFSGIAQLVTQGGFSGAVLTELNGAEKGMKPFIIQIGMTIYRLGEIWAGVKQGFIDGIKAMAPYFEGLVAVFGVVWDMMKRVWVATLELFNITGASADSFKTLGKILGWIGAIIAAVLVLPIMILVGTLGLIIGLVWVVVEAFKLLGWVIGALAYGLYVLFGEALPALVMWAGGKILGMFKWLFMEAIPGFGIWLGTKLTNIVLGIKDLFLSIPDAVLRAMDAVLRFLGRAAANIPAAIRPGFLNGLIDYSNTAQLPPSANPMAPATATPAVQSNGVPYGQNAVSMPAVASAEAQAQQVRVQMANQTSALQSMPQPAPQQVVVQSVLQVDGETIATAVSNGQRANAQRFYTPVAASQ